MKSQILKIAGCKTDKEFYAKYPTEESFFSKHPEAKQFMQLGGSNAGQTTTTTKHTLADLKDNGFNRTLLDINGLSYPNGYLNALPDQGFFGKIKGIAGGASALAGATLGYSKLFNNKEYSTTTGGSNTLPNSLDYKKQIEDPYKNLIPSDYNVTPNATMPGYNPNTAPQDNGNMINTPILDNNQFQNNPYGNGFKPQIDPYTGLPQKQEGGEQEICMPLPHGGTTCDPVFPKKLSKIELNDIQEYYAKKQYEKYGKVLLTDKANNTTYIGGKRGNDWDLEKFEVLTGVAGTNPSDEIKNREATMADLEKNPKLRVTPVGTFPLEYHNDIYGMPGYWMLGSESGDKYSPGVAAIHQTYKGPDDLYRDKLYNNGNNEDNYRSFGCINCQKPNMQKIIDFVGRNKNNEMASVVIDSRLNPKDIYKYSAVNSRKNGAIRVDDFFTHRLQSRDISPLDIEKQKQEQAPFVNIKSKEDKLYDKLSSKLKFQDGGGYNNFNFPQSSSPSLYDNKELYNRPQSYEDLYKQGVVTNKNEYYNYLIKYLYDTKYEALKSNPDLSKFTKTNDDMNPFANTFNAW